MNLYAALHLLIKFNFIDECVCLCVHTCIITVYTIVLHFQTSLMGTIINLAQNFVGSNNINLLQPIGQFGTRLHGGKDAASPR